VIAGLSCLIAVLIASLISRWRRIAAPDVRLLLSMATVAQPIGLVVLGFIADNAPIELRYFAFGLPFIGLLMAAALPACLRAVVLAVQVVALLGLMVRSETMQPARAVATTAAVAVGDGVVLLPRGNDGVGIVGAFAVEAPPTMPLLAIGSDTTPREIRARAASYPSATLALLEQDASSRATAGLLRAAFDDPCWRWAGGIGSVMTFKRICAAED
jgi:hypothetical protein